ncbi:hypothetical protein ACP70R_008317 [Stipagrostis hirtigluma subsp. patula]
MAVTELQEAEEREGSPSPGGIGHLLLRHNSPLVQVSLVGLVCLCCPGMFNALTGLGGGGQLDHAAADNANTALYACFAVFGVVGGGAYNLLGPRPTLALGALAYPLYAASFLYYSHRRSQAFPVAAGSVLGVGAAFLWAAQGAVVTSYPPPGRRGAHISLFWCVFNLSALGGLLPFFLNYHRDDDATRAAGSVNDATYVAFMAVMLLGAALALLVLPPSTIVRDDGARPTAFSFSSPATEAAETLRLFAGRRTLLLLPAAWASGFVHTYQLNNVNGVLFTTRTRGLNTVFYGAAQMLGSAGIGWLLDLRLAGRRRRRGLAGVAVVSVLGAAVWGGGLANQLRYRDGRWEEELIDFKDGRRYAGPCLLYLSYGMLDAVFQSLIYWIIGALADESQILSRYVGFFKGVQSAGAAVAWQVDTRHVPLMSQLIVNWALMTFSYPLLALLVFLAVKDEDNPVSSVEHGDDSDSKP